MAAPSHRRHVQRAHHLGFHRLGKHHDENRQGALDRFVCDPEYGLFKHDEESCLNLVGVNTSTLHVPDEFLEQGYICLGGFQVHWFS